MTSNPTARNIYIAAHGPLPSNQHVHHIDGNQNNNALDNLIAMPIWAHAQLHRWQDRHGQIGPNELRSYVDDANDYEAWLEKTGMPF